jgi:hypothetical protein
MSGWMGLGFGYTVAALTVTFVFNASPTICSGARRPGGLSHISC